MDVKWTIESLQSGSPAIKGATSLRNFRSVDFAEETTIHTLEGRFSSIVGDTEDLVALACFGLRQFAPISVDDRKLVDAMMLLIIIH